MDETVRITREPEYLPLIEGLTLSYHHSSTEFSGVETVEVRIDSVAAFRDDARAKAVMTRIRMGQVRSSEFEIRRSRKEVSSGDGVLGLARREFVLPALPGKEWIEEPDRHVIHSLDATIQVPAGRFTRCLRINTFLAGGDGGSAIRYYAPGVGYVYEEYSGETRGSRVSLAAFQFKKPS